MLFLAEIAIVILAVLFVPLWVKKPGGGGAGKNRTTPASVDKYEPMPGDRGEQDNDGDRRFVIDETNTLPRQDDFR